MRYFGIIIFVLLAKTGFCQKEGNVWCFGSNAKLDFNSGKAVSPGITAMNARYGCASISTSKGRLLFYTNGQTVWDSTNKAMPNSKNNLNGNSISSSQSAIIVPHPDSSYIYFIFTTPYNGSDRVSYSIINMKLNGGLGDVYGSINRALPTISAGKVTAVKHANRKDYWMVVPNLGSDEFHAYKISSSGIDITPVISKTGYKLKIKYIGLPDSITGYLKLSPNGRKIFNINFIDSCMMADFDPATGKLSNAWLFRPSNRPTNIGCEFSAKSRFLYISDFSGALFQYDVYMDKKTTFLASRKTVDSSMFYSASNLSGFQLGPDGKIYIAEGYTNQSLHVIHNPDSTGKKVHFQKNYISLSGGSQVAVGLPDFVQSYFEKKAFKVTQNCSRDTTSFKIINTYELDSAKWEFGDAASGADNYSKKTSSVFHCYKNNGSYKIRLISYHKQFTDTIYETFSIGFSKLNLGKDTILCQSEYITIGPSDNFTHYKWSTTDVTKQIFVTKSGTYHITVTDFDGCASSDTIKIENAIAKAGFTINNSFQCLKNNFFNFKETTKYTNDKQAKSNWYFSDGTSKTDTVVTKTFTKPGVYSVKLVSQSQLGCVDSITKTFNVYTSPKVSFNINGSMQCFNTHSYDFKINKDTGKVSYEWDLGDQSFNNPGDVIAKKYAKEGAYKIRLIATTDKNCKDTLIKSIIVLPVPKADFSWDLACSRTITNFKYSGSKPIASFDWIVDFEGFSTIENPSKLFGTTGTKKIKLRIMADNGCLDTLSKTIDVKFQSTADFAANDVCENDSVVFINKSKDATGYKWRFGDGQTSNKQDAKHKYQIISTTTFNVTLVAVVTGGCSDSVVNAITVNQNPNADFTATQNGNKLELKAKAGYASYKWLFDTKDSINVTQANYTHTLKAWTPIKVCLTATDNASCQSQTCKTITLGISKFENQSGFKLYPNPNSGNFSIEIENPSNDVSIEVYDMLGELLKKVDADSYRHEKVTTLNLNVADGIYLVKVQNGTMVWNRKIIVSIGEHTRK